MKLESVIQRFYGRNTALSIDRAVITIERFAGSKAEVFRKNGGRNFCRALDNAVRILKKLSEENLSHESNMYRSFYEFFHSMISKVCDYLTINPEMTYIETALLDINSEELTRLKKDLDAINLRMRRAINELSESYERQHLCIMTLKFNIDRIKEMRKSTTECNSRKYGQITSEEE